MEKKENNNAYYSVILPRDLRTISSPAKKMSPVPINLSPKKVPAKKTVKPINKPVVKRVLATKKVAVKAKA